MPEILYLQRQIWRLQEALANIRENEGKVCAEYELCTHPACKSSYAAWAIASKALEGGGWCQSATGTT